MTGERESQHEADQHGAVVHPSSGPSTPSPPRRPGTGTRQAPLAEQVPEVAWVPGQVLYADEPVVINEGKPVTTVRVVNTADRPVQVGSHFHFAEVNAALAFDRDAAWGRRLAVPSGGAMRFEPGALIEVDLIPIAGRRIVPGLRGMCGGGLDG